MSNGDPASLSSKTVAEQQEEYRARVADGMWPDANVEDRLRLLADVERLTRELAKERDNASHEVRRWKADANERNRLRAVLKDLAADASDSGCLACDRTARKAREALSGEPIVKRAYYETHDPPHCPTCGCGSAGETTANGWTVEEQLPDGSWVRNATAHIWQTNRDAHQQRDELALRFPKKLFGVTRWPKSSEKAGEKP